MDSSGFGDAMMGHFIMEIMGDWDEVAVDRSIKLVRGRERGYVVSAIVILRSS